MTNRQGLDAPHVSSGAVDALIERFGGLRPMADKLGVPVSTLQGWKKRGVIPSSRQAEVRAAAEKYGIPDLEASLEGVFRTDEKGADEKGADEKGADEKGAVDGAGDDAAAPVESVIAKPAADNPTTAAKPAAAKPAAAKSGTGKSGAEMKAAAERVGEGDAVSDPAGSAAPTPVTAEPAAATPIAESAPAATPSGNDEIKPAANKVSRRDTLLANDADQANPDADEAIKNGTPEEVDVTQASSVAAGDNEGQARGQSNQGTGAAIAAAVLAVVGAAVSVTAPLWSHDYLQRQVNVALIEKRTASFEGALGVGATERAALGDRVAALESALTALEAKVAKGPAVVAVMAVRDLNGALASGEPFLDALTGVRAAGLLTAEDAPALTALLPYAAAGVPTRDALARSFAWTAPGAVGSGMGSLIPSDLPGRVWDWMAGVAGSIPVPSADQLPSMPAMADIGAALRLTTPPAASETVPAQPAEAPTEVVVTPTPAPEAAPVTTESAPAGDSMGATASLLAEAGSMLGAGDLAGALTTMKALDGPASKAVAGWVADAEARLAADTLSQTLTNRVSAGLK